MVILVLVFSTLFVVFWFIIIGKHLIEKCRQCFMMNEIISEKVNEEITRYKKDQYVPSEFVKKNEDDIRRKKIRDIHNQHINDWMKEDEKFIATMATHTLFESLERNSCALVVGIAGNGKSSIIRHIALKLKSQEHYEIVPIVLSPEIIFEFRKTDRKQIFIVDDLCGKVNVNAQSVDIWVSQINEILKLIDTAHKNETKEIAEVKFLFATRLSIFEDSIFQKLRLLMKYAFPLSEFSLTEEEKLKMINKYITLEADTKLFKKLKSDDAYFPLLCKIAERKTPDQIIKLFSNLKGFIKQDLMDLKENNHLQFCIITLCAILNNNFKEEILNDVYESDIERQAFDNICMEFNLGTNKDQVKSKIKAQLANLEGMYMTKTENYYHFIHAKVYHIAVVVCGQTFLHSFIKYIRTSFIAERFCFQSTMANINKNTISIDNEDAEKRFFDRLMFDLEKGETYSTFHSNQLTNKSYRDKFCNYCRIRKQKVGELLKHFSVINSKNDDRNYDDYIDFKKQYHFFSHQMRRPFIESAWEGYSDIVELLLEFNFDINESEKFGRTPLLVACLLGKKKHEEVVNFLLKNNADHSLCDKNKQSPLLAASRGGYYSIVKALLQHNADVNQCDIKGNSPLLVAASDSPLETVKILSSKMSDFSKCNSLGQTPICVASIHGRVDVLKYLLQFCNELVSKPDNEGRSPLFIACKKGYLEIVQLLLSNHADVSQSDWSKRSPLFIASAKGHDDIVKTLLQNKAKINQCDEEERTPLFMASDKGHASTVQILINCEADLNAMDNRKCTPLFAACRQGFIDIVKLLNENGASITECNKWNASPLFAACRQGYLGIVKYLVENGCNISDPDNSGTTPLLVAHENGNTEIENYLIQKSDDFHQSNQCKKT
ncbi:putative ankyrin repeat protein RBE_0220 [Mytilus trossulus]|uniref:putative ankyrin repeat protein RBE_0220 n=1 Tax=Mytilus trossulus TaxID=6551 RepID=UPI0030060D27